jgi:Ca2+/H+ antiporter
LTAFISLGILALMVGGTMLVTGIRRHQAQHPKHVAMLIAGMMITAFGLLLTGFAIAWQAAAPLDLNAGGAK